MNTLLEAFKKEVCERSKEIDPENERLVLHEHWVLYCQGCIYRRRLLSGECCAIQISLLDGMMTLKILSVAEDHYNSNRISASISGVAFRHDAKISVYERSRHGGRTVIDIHSGASHITLEVDIDELIEFFKDAKQFLDETDTANMLMGK